MLKTIKPFFFVVNTVRLVTLQWMGTFISKHTITKNKKKTQPTPPQLKKKTPKKIKIKQTHPFYFIDKLSNLLRNWVKITQWIFKKYVKQTMSFPNLNMQLPRYRHLSKGLLQMYIYLTVNGRVQKCYRQVDLLIRVFGEFKFYKWDNNPSKSWNRCIIWHWLFNAQILSNKLAF